MQSIRPRRGAAKAIIVDWLTFHADRSRYYYGMDTLSSDTPASSSWALLPQALSCGNLKGTRRHINTRIEVSQPSLRCNGENLQEARVVITYIGRGPMVSAGPPRRSQRQPSRRRREGRH